MAIVPYNPFVADGRHACPGCGSPLFDAQFEAMTATETVRSDGGIAEFSTFRYVKPEEAGGRMRASASLSHDPADRVVINLTFDGAGHFWCEHRFFCDNGTVFIGGSIARMTLGGLKSPWFRKYIASLIAKLEKEDEKPRIEAKSATDIEVVP
jgi:hypothetical protein